MEQQDNCQTRKRKRTPHVMHCGREMWKRKVIKHDLINRLPTHILQCILGLLPADSAARAAGVCKKWHQAWRTSSHLNLDELRYKRKCFPVCREIFLKSIQSAIVNHDMEHLQELRIWSMIFYNRDREVHSLALQVIHLAFLKGKIKTLDLNFGTKIFHETNHSCFYLPSVIFTEGSYLTCLTLEGCIFPNCDIINFKCLKKFIVASVYISDQMLFDIICNGLLIEFLSLRDCRNLENIKFFSPNITSLLIDRCKQLKSIELDVPCLDSFEYIGNLVEDENSHLDVLDFVPHRLNLLNTVKISEVKVKSAHFASLTSKFKVVKSMHLRFCDFDEPPRILLPSLKILEVFECRKCRHMVTNTPNVEHLQLASSVGGIKFKSKMVYVCLNNLFLGSGVTISNKALPIVIKAMGLLESLELCGCKGFTRLSIDNMRLRTLIVDRARNILDANIYAPNLVVFKYVGHVLMLYRIVASSYLHAHLHLYKDSGRKKINFYDSKPDERLITLLESFNPDCMALNLVLNDVKLYIPIIKIFSYPIESLKSFHVQHKFNNKSFICLLHTVISLVRCQEELTVEKSLCSVYMKFENKDVRDFMGRNHDCLRDHLSEITIKKFGGTEEEMEVVDYLLGKAANLRTMRVSLLRTRLKADRGQIISEIKKYKRTSKFTQVQIH